MLFHSPKSRKTRTSSDRTPVPPRPGKPGPAQTGPQSHQDQGNQDQLRPDPSPTKTRETRTSSDRTPVMTETSRTQKVRLHVPDLEELSTVLQVGLQSSFAEVQVRVVDCPDLTQDPFQFPVKGLCGSPRITDVGGVPYLVPLVHKDKEYDMNAVAKEVELPGAFMLGAGAVASRIVGMNAELMPLVLTEAEGRPAVNASFFSSIDPIDGRCCQEKYSERFSDCSFGLLANLYACQGDPGKVIEVRAKKRTGVLSLVTSLRKTLENAYPEDSLALGGTFIIQKGTAKIHIMPRQFSSCPLNTDEDVNSWLRHLEVHAPLICQSVLVSRDPGLDLRLEHTHCFSRHGDGGHYYIDTSPDVVDYLGYFVPAEFVYRIDRPKDTHKVGRE
ncbi:ester hydrolase C11orf54 homolog [Sphaeramia orbicularis]|uniref:ester hydrolase C11orf54 homolog n=1 Tax=Sphaeramia orbicularis TaxID=375764 RepID=UPI00117CA7B6|nr:ester hydrolase C11orf54 homolog [Sphaeramia orbicularis]